MKEMNSKTGITNTQVFNVIILDRSDLMECIRRAAVDGFNETLVGIKKAQEKFANTRMNFVTRLSDYKRNKCRDDKNKNMSKEARRSLYADMSNKVFDEGEEVWE